MRAALPALFSALLLLAACSRDAGNPAPPRIDTPLPVPALTSTISVPVSASLDALEARLEARVPQTLWTINEVRPACLPGQRISIGALGVKRAKITPDIACHIRSEARRGRLRLSGAEETLRLTMPITARVTVRDAGKRLTGETATASAIVNADITLNVTPEWQPDARVNLDYAWQQPPSLDLLGVKVGLKAPADKALADLVSSLEAEIPRQIAAIHTREALAAAWASAFTTIELNRQNPEVWLSVAPEALHVSPWQVSGRRITLPLTISATAQTTIGHRPPDPSPTPLPPPAPPTTDSGVSLSLPVIADYAVLEPVLAKALAKVSRKGVLIPDVGRVSVRFGKVTLYPTTRGRLAVGLEIDAKSPRGLVEARGTLWLAGTPRNEPGSQRVFFEDLEVASQTDSQGFDLLVAITNDPDIKAAIAQALTQDFSNDLEKLMVKIAPKLAALPLGRNFLLNAEITRFKNGQVSPLGQRLFMAVEAQATAALSYRPAPKSGPAPAKTAIDPPSKTPPARP